MRILIAEDEEGLRKSLELLLKKQHELTLCVDGRAALEALRKASYDLVITDHQMPGLTGLELLVQGREISPSTAFLLMTAHGSVEHAVEAIRQGADDYLTKPFELTEMEHRIRRVEELRTWRAVSALKADRPRGTHRIIGKSRAMQEAGAFVKSVASAPSPVLLLGASGSGKEVIARAIHEAGKRASQPFVAVNCASLREQLMDSELFGHEKGAFTGAQAAKQGKFELASGGTLFLDEIGELSAEVQANLLRVLQEREFYRVGGVRLVRTDARVIAATHRDLKKMVAEGKFREDLYFRMNVLTFELPPLAARREDIPLLVEHFWQGLQRQFGEKLVFPQDVATQLAGYGYPGNVRELQNVLERLMVLGTSAGKVTAAMLPRELGDAGPVASREAVPLPTLLKNGITPLIEEYERSLVRAVMKETANHQAKAAALLKVSRGGLHYKLRKLGLAAEFGLDEEEAA